MDPRTVISDQEIDSIHKASLKIRSEAGFVLDHPGLNNPAKGDQNYLLWRQAINFPREDQMLDEILGIQHFSSARKQSSSLQFTEKNRQILRNVSQSR